MHLRSLWAGLSTAALFATAITFSGSASAAPDCSVVDFNPKTVAMGVDNSADVQFVVSTDCAPGTEVLWYASGFWPDQTNPAQPMIMNFPTHPWTKYYVYAPEGKLAWKRKTDYHTGILPMSVRAFVGEEKTENFLPNATSFNLAVVHETTFGGSFDASPEPRRAGQTMKVTGKLSYADWKTHSYQGLATNLVLQFRPAGGTTYKTVKKVASNGASASTTVKVTTSGYWRYRYAGDGILNGAANSNSDYVAVKK